MEAATSTDRHFWAALTQATRITVRGRYADFVPVSLGMNVGLWVLVVWKHSSKAAVVDNRCGPPMFSRRIVYVTG
jgi:hypothetical protein